MSAVQNDLKRFNLFVLFLISTQYSITALNESNARIVGGTLTEISVVPYLVNVRHNGVFICGGSLVAPTYVITAAHCARGLGASKLLVVGGATNLSDNGVRRGVVKVFTPKAYSPNTLNADAAVLKLASPLSGTNIATIPLCNSNWKVGEFIKVSGWGQTQARASAGPSNRVRSVDVKLVGRANCARQYRQHGTITSTMFCASIPGQKDACDGDSGGPAVYKGQLCGIVSWGVGCANRNYPGVYTSIKTVRSFIDSAMKM